MIRLGVLVLVSTVVSWGLFRIFDFELAFVLALGAAIFLGWAWPIIWPRQSGPAIDVDVGRDDFSELKPLLPAGWKIESMMVVGEFEKQTNRKIQTIVFATLRAPNGRPAFGQGETKQAAIRDALERNGATAQ